MVTDSRFTPISGARAPTATLPLSQERWPRTLGAPAHTHFPRARCCGLEVCVPPIHIGIIPPPCGGVGRAPQEWPGREGAIMASGPLGEEEEVTGRRQPPPGTEPPAP